MVDNLIDELDGRLVRVTLAYPMLKLEVQKARKHTLDAMNNSRDRNGDPVNKDKTLRTAVKKTLELVRKHPELKEFVKPAVKNAVAYLEPGTPVS
jgi:hypothetical protein